MASVTFDPAEQMIAIDNVGAAVRHPLLRAYVRNNQGSIEEGGLILLPTSEEHLSSRFQTLKKLFQSLGIELEAGGQIGNALQEVESAEERFEEFSRKAYEIWHADIKTEEFREFVDVVEQACPQRTFYLKQLLSAFHLAFSQNACNFSVPGAGKTSVVYAAYAYLRSLPAEDPKRVDKLLIVGPLSSFKAWEDEYFEIFGAKPEVQRISGAISKDDRIAHLRGIGPTARSVEVTLTSYQTLAAMEEEFQNFLKHVAPRAMVVLDEAHYIKSSDGVQAAAALRLAPSANSRVVLTGTPAPNGYEDLANLFRFIYPDRNVIGFPFATLRAMTDGALQSAIPELKRKIRPFYTRIKKADLDLPSVSEEQVLVDMGPEQELIYRSLENRIVPHLRHQLTDQNSAVRVRARLIRLRQAATNPELLLRPLESEEGLFEGDLNISELEVAQKIRDFSARLDLSRLATCRSLVNKILEEQGKVLIWSYFIGNLNLLRDELEDQADYIDLLTGSTPSRGQEDEAAAELGTREHIIDKFHEVDGRCILIANPQAVGESISLHKACRSAIYFDRDFNAGRFIQSKDRIHRYSPSQQGDVTYYYLTANTTIDVDIDDRLTRKEARLAGLVDAEDIPLLTAVGDGELEDIRAILEAYERRKAE